MNEIKQVHVSHNEIIRHSTSVGEHENKMLKKLEKKLRKKSNAISGGFKKDGLDYLLEVCESIESNDLDDLRESKKKKQKVEKITVKEIKKKSNKNTNTPYEDIYGRIHSTNGSIIVPEPQNNEVEINQEISNNTKLRRILTGLLNRLAENNMSSISKQIEELYMKNSRQEMNKTLLEIINKNLIKDIHSPERLIIEHVVLIAVLSANIGYEIGAQFLESFSRKFIDLHKANLPIEDKQLDNLVQILAQMYNFKICHNTLLYDIIQELLKSFLEKDVECILLILRTVGFTLRKDDPIALKNLILELQFKARSNTNEDTDPRVKFMLEVLLAIKNNNMSKIPNYDTSYSEHLKKIFKTYVRKGHSLTPLSIKLNEILNVDKKGRWWIVGSSWVGNENNSKNNVNVRTENNNNSNKNAQCSVKFNENLLELAQRQHMNTDIRRNIFCILMSAEDYIDAFEKLLQLNLKNTQEREIINVIIHCCLQEKTFNAYYAVLVQRFCDYQKNYQITIRYSIWDKIKILKECSNNQINNLACFISHLLINKSISITVLKIIEFNELETATLNFIRKILVNVLLHNDESECLQVFQKISSHSSSTDDKLKIFRKSLRLFIHHFILANFDTNQINLKEDQKIRFQNRVEILDKFL